MNLDFGRCQVYKLNISACLTERELDYYNLFCDGITRKELKKRLGVDYPTSEMLSEEFHISLEDAADLLKAQMNKKCFRKFLTDEIEKFSPNEVREIRKSAIYVADEEGNLTDRIKDNKKIVWFGNECVRRCNVDLKDIPLLDQFLLLKCGSKALTGVLNQIVERGVNLDGKHYLFYTSTTGQMKETEITLVEEEYWKENEYALMCGLTEERINSKGGINMGKYFAAKALNLSNSIKYDSGISIDEVIIVPDFKTFVSGMVNYLDVNTLDIQEKKMEIEIEHMDGAGIFIPGTFPCSCQIRGGWLKGAVFPFDFHKFIEKYRDKVSAANMIDALEEFRMLNDLKEKSERRDFYSKIGGTELSEEKIEKATFGKEFEIFYLENYRLKLHERVPALTTDEIENISIYALDLVRSKKEMSEEEYKNAEREMDIEISRMAFEHLYDDIKEVHERLPYLTPEECQEWFDCWKRWSAFQDNKLWNILTFDYVMRGWKLEELNDQREKNMSSLFDYIVLGNQEGKIKDGSE